MNINNGANDFYLYLVSCSPFILQLHGPKIFQSSFQNLNLHVLVKKINFGNLVPRVSPLNVPGSER